MARVAHDSPEPKVVAPFATVRKEADGKPFEGVERRRMSGPPLSVPIFPEIQEANEVTVFHELGKALTSSLQLDQVLRTIMEKINEVLRPDTWSLLLMDQEREELYFQIATGKGAEALKDVRIKVGQGLAGWVAKPVKWWWFRTRARIRDSSAAWMKKRRWRRGQSLPCRCGFAISASA